MKSFIIAIGSILISILLVPLYVYYRLKRGLK